MVVPRALSVAINRYSVSTSLSFSDAVGSSMMTIWASWDVAFTISTICRCATASSLTNRFGGMLRSNSCISAAQRWLSWRRLTMPDLPGSLVIKIFSATVSKGTRLNSW